MFPRPAIVATVCHRRILAIVVGLLAGFLPQPLDRSAFAAPIEKGDTAVTKVKAPVQDAERVMLTLDEGTELVADDTQGEWVLVSVLRGGEQIQGWVSMDNLALVQRRGEKLAQQAKGGNRVYYRVRFGDLHLTDGVQPWKEWYRCGKPGRGTMYPRAVLDGPGEVYVAFESSDWISLTNAELEKSGWLVVCAPQGRDVTGSLYFPMPGWSGMNRSRFQIPATAADPTGKSFFHWGKMDSYARLASRQLPGSAWFRYQSGSERSLVADRPAQGGTGQTRRPDTDSGMELTRTFDFFSGGRALAESLQLDRRLAGGGADDSPVAITSLKGITTQEIDWKPMLKDTAAKFDPLAKSIPYDQHVVFFPSLQAAIAVSDEATVHDTPLLHFAEPRSENAHVLERYQRQLGLRLDELCRLAGPQGVRSVALTGSDPYFPMGTDIALLLEAEKPAALEQLLWERIVSNAAGSREVRQDQGMLGGLKYRCVRSPNRRISSYLAREGNVVMVANSPHQVQRLGAVRNGSCNAIAALPEYQFFRTRYSVGAAGETAFVFLSDATIRRWCSPRWRIADSRRVRAAAELTEIQSARMSDFVIGKVETGPLNGSRYGIDLGTVSMTPAGVLSSRYGTLEFMTPVAELEIDLVTKAEASAYAQWRDTYQRNWTWAFDPVALRAGITPASVSADMTVMPLILGTRYRELISIAQGAAIPPSAGDCHPCLLHGIIAVNRSSPTVKLVVDFLASLFEIRDGLAWLGATAELYFDDDSFWQDLARLQTQGLQTASSDFQAFMQANLYRLPIAVRMAVNDRAQARAVLTALVGKLAAGSKSAVGIDRLNYRGQEYARVHPEQDKGPAVYLYSYLSDDAITLTFSEKLVERAIDRQIARSRNETPSHAPLAPVSVSSWLGAHLCLQVDQAILEVANGIARGEYQRSMQDKAWETLPILNEWKRLFPDRDPVEVHRQVWHSELVCPGRGQYVWNDEFKTMESTVYGHPAAPKTGPSAPPVLGAFSSGSFGLDFEEKGLRARMKLSRSPSAKAGPAK
jgi:hypothetical protein